MSLLFAFSFFALSVNAEGVVYSKVPELINTPKQPVFKRFKRDLPYQHDRGFFAGVSVGPAWIKSFQHPEASAVRFSWDISIGWLPWERTAIHASSWGSFLEKATAVLVGPGITSFFSNNWALSATLGMGKVFSTSLTKDQEFNEWTLGTQLKATKFWWIDDDISLGVGLAADFHAFSPSQKKLSSIGGSLGLRIEFLFN